MSPTQNTKQLIRIVVAVFLGAFEVVKCALESLASDWIQLTVSARETSIWVTAKLTWEFQQDALTGSCRDCLSVPVARRANPTSHLAMHRRSLRR